MRVECGAASRRLTVLACVGLWTGCASQDFVLGEGRLRANADAAQAGRFSEPTAIAEVSGAHTVDDDPSLTADLTELCFNSKREGGLGHEDIWCTQRSTPNEAWSSPTAATELNTEERETGIALAANGLTIWFSSDRSQDDDGLDVYMATRANRGAAWSTPQRIDGLSSAQDDLVSSVSSSERAIFLARRTDDEADYDLFMAERSDEQGPWAEPRPISELNTQDEESDAFLLSDEHQLLFTRDEDLYLAERSTPEAAFRVTGPIDELNSSDDDRDAWADHDFGYVVFSSDRDGSYRLYVATR
jgi:hypothetical protein